MHRSDSGTIQEDTPVIYTWVNSSCRVTPTGQTWTDGALQKETSKFTFQKSWDKSITWEANGKQARHECYHTQSETSWDRGNAFYSSEIQTNGTGTTTVSTYRRMESTNVRVGNAPSAITDREKVAASLDWSTAYSRLLDDASGLMPDDNSILVNVAEFASLRGMVKGISRPIKRILDYVKGHPNRKIKAYLPSERKQKMYRDLVKKHPSLLKEKSFIKAMNRDLARSQKLRTVELRSMRWTLRDLAAIHLAKSFGVDPLAEDLANWCTKYYQVQFHLDWWKKAYDGKIGWFRAYTDRVTSSTTESVSFTSIPFKWSIAEARLTLEESRTRSVETIGIVSAKVRADIHRTGMKQQFALLHQALGLNVPLQLAWELVPFSFVVDWFIPIGDFISRVEPRRQIGGLARQLHVLEVWYTVVHQASHVNSIAPAQRTTVLKRARYDETRSASYSGSEYKTYYRLYQRTRGYPVSGYTPIVKSRFGLKQAALSLSLALQRIIR